MAKQKHERLHMFTACELCAAARHQPRAQCVHFNLHNPHLWKWIRSSRGIYSPCTPLFLDSRTGSVTQRLRV
ncbi:MAG TPA: hypothetical protein VNA23_02565 [Anaerolineales bacterium]|nr:hypothetical protein [Anaerolineales bacterium]